MGKSIGIVSKIWYNVWNLGRFRLFEPLARVIEFGALAQLIRALQWHWRGHEFESHMLHQIAELAQW